MFNFTIVTVVLLGLSFVEKDERVPEVPLEPPKIEIPVDGEFSPEFAFPDYRYC